MTVKVVGNGVSLAQITLPQAANRPGIFRNGAGAAGVNQDGTINAASNPAKSGNRSLGNEYFSTPGGGFQAIYAGPAPGLISAVFQINVQLPQDPPESGPVSILLRAGGVVSPPALIYVAP